MKYRDLPGTTLKASVIVLGAAWFGTEIPEDQAFDLMDTFMNLGGNFLDTAHMYASWVPGGAGKSEMTIGKWLKSGERSRVVIGTKGADKGMTEQGIRVQLDESLMRLDTDYVDFYWLHTDDPSVPVGDILAWLNAITEEGRIRAFGCSNWALGRIQEARDYACVHRMKGFSASQIGWSLARVNPEVAGGKGQVYMDDEIFAFHEQTRMPVVAYSSQAGGFFAGKYDPEGPPAGKKPNSAIMRYYGTEGNYRKLAAVKQLAKTKGCSANQISVYLLNQVFAGFAIAGAGTSDYVADSCGAADVDLSPEEVAALGQGRLPNR